MHQKNKISRNKFKQGSERLISENDKKSNKKLNMTQIIERHTIIIDWKINITKMSILLILKENYRFNVTLSKY